MSPGEMFLWVHEWSTYRGPNPTPEDDVIAALRATDAVKALRALGEREVSPLVDAMLRQIQGKEP